MRPITVCLLWVALLVGGAASARAADGRVEINLAAALAGGVTSGDGPGFPIEINASGSYVLSGDISVPAGAKGIVIGADDVALDLGGFSLRGPALCIAGSCPSSAASGITGGLTSGTVVENGSVSGFGAECVGLGFWARVERLAVRSCGSAGVVVGDGSLVLDSSVGSVGSYGIVFGGEPGVRAGNVVTDVALSAPGTIAVFAGTSTRGNVCRDGSCSRHATRRYYLTKTANHNAVQALAACDVGYHTASIYELMDPSSLEYDPLLGDSREVSPTGPISINTGRVRTGVASSPTTNCRAGTSINSNEDGAGAILQGFAAPMNAAATIGSPWSISGSIPCNTTLNVWCIED